MGKNKTEREDEENETARSEEKQVSKSIRIPQNRKNLRKAFAASKSLSIFSMVKKNSKEEKVELDQFNADYLGEM